MDTEILLVDEVLAVGDAAFQKKCLGKMGDVAAKEGRTVLFVSHNMAAVQNLCSKTFLLRAGNLVKEGETADVISNYLSIRDTSDNNGVFDLGTRENRYNNGKQIIKKVLFLGQDNIPRSTFLMGEPLRIGIFVEGLSEHNGSHLGIVFKSEHDQWVSSAATWMCKTTVQEPRNKSEWAILDIEKLCLTPGKWGLYISCSIHGTGIYLDKIEEGISFIVEGSDYYGTGHLITKYYGLFCMDFNWKIVHEINNST
jgi:lipopolysaccharide transport system ATP-binding protein